MTAEPEEASKPRVVVKARSEGVPRVTRRRELAEQTARMPGWHLAETAHYFVLFETKDPRYERELGEHIESIRRLFRVHFAHPLADPVPVSSSPNVLRVCRDQESYHEYGGGFGSAGYWKKLTAEVVVFAGDWRTLQSTLFFEYLDAAYDEPPAPPWFVHGHADWYSDFALEDGAWVERLDVLEVKRVRALIEQDHARPLRELVELDAPSFASDPAATHGQAGSFVRFLRTGGAEGAGQDERYGEILDDYFEVLLAARDPELALDQAFADVDWSALDAAWRAWVLASE